MPVPLNAPPSMPARAPAGSASTAASAPVVEPLRPSTVTPPDWVYVPRLIVVVPSTRAKFPLLVTGPTVLEPLALTVPALNMSLPIEVPASVSTPSLRRAPLPAMARPVRSSAWPAERRSSPRLATCETARPGAESTKVCSLTRLSSTVGGAPGPKVTTPGPAPGAPAGMSTARTLLPSGGASHLLASPHSPLPPCHVERSRRSIRSAPATKLSL